MLVKLLVIDSGFIAFRNHHIFKIDCLLIIPRGLKSAQQCGIKRSKSYAQLRRRKSVSDLHCDTDRELVRESKRLVCIEQRVRFRKTTEIMMHSDLFRNAIWTEKDRFISRYSKHVLTLHAEMTKSLFCCNSSFSKRFSS